MAIKSRPFGGVELTDEDWDEFVSRMDDVRPNEAATAAAAEGGKLVAIYEKNKGKIPMEYDEKVGEFIPVPYAPE